MVQEIDAAHHKQRAEWASILEEIADERDRVATDRKRLSMERAQQAKRDQKREVEAAVNPAELSRDDLRRLARSKGFVQH